MKHSLLLRELNRDDLPSIRNILDATGLFPSDLLDAMAEPYLSGQAPHHWIVACRLGRVAGFAYAEPERMTEGTYNLLAIAVDPDVQREAIGKALVTGLIERLSQSGGRVLIVETSSLDDYADTRAFYASQSFSQEARIRDFYTEGEDKILFWKKL